MTKALSVWWEGATVGTLLINRQGSMRFAYAQTWLDEAARPAISVSLPRRARAFNQRECRPFFAGVLPEEGQRRSVAEALGVSRSNDFALLEALGGDVAGALSLWPEGETPPAQGPASKSRPLADKDLIKLLDSLPTRPMLVGRHGLRLSLAGAQSKLPVVMREGRVALPKPGEPTTHIVKPAIPRFPKITENEAFVMTLAAEIGLPVAALEGRKVGGRSYLLVTRYDRRIDASGRAHRLHQEDFCQALGIPPERKYAAEGGPTFKACFELTRQAVTRPAGAVLTLLDAAIFNLIVGNADAHGKNFSLLHRGGAIVLAPLYDLLSTVSYPDLSPRLAMKIGRQSKLEEIGPPAWRTFAEDAGLAAPFVLRRVTELAEAVRATSPKVLRGTNLEALDAKALKEQASLVVRRAERVAKIVA